MKDIANDTEFEEAFEVAITFAKQIGVICNIAFVILRNIERNEPIWFEQCASCGNTHGYRRRRNTMYEDEDLNIVTLCDECFEIEWQYWEERWNEYYAGCL